VHQKTKEESERWICDQHDDAKCRSMMCWKVVVANPMSCWPYQCTSSNKTQKMEDGSFSALSTSAIMSAAQNHNVLTMPNEKS
jgi:hypothetical protein